MTAEILLKVKLNTMPVILTRSLFSVILSFVHY